MSLTGAETGAQGCAPIWERGVLPCTLAGDPSLCCSSASCWLALEDGRLYSSRLAIWWRSSCCCCSGAGCCCCWPFSAGPLTRSPLAPDSTSLPVDDSTWQIYVAASCQRAGVGVLVGRRISLQEARAHRFLLSIIKISLRCLIVPVNSCNVLFYMMLGFNFFKFIYSSAIVVNTKWFTYYLVLIRKFSWLIFALEKLETRKLLIV